MANKRRKLVYDRRIVLSSPDAITRGANGIQTTLGAKHPVWAARVDDLGFQDEKREGEALSGVNRTNFFIRRMPLFEGLTTKWGLVDERGRVWKILAVKEWNGKINWRLVVRENV